MKWIEEHLDASIISEVIHKLRNLRNLDFFTISSLIKIDKNTSSWRPLMYNFYVFHVIFRENFEYICIASIRRCYAASKNKVSIIILRHTVMARKDNFYDHKLVNNEITLIEIKVISNSEYLVSHIWIV